MAIGILRLTLLCRLRSARTRQLRCPRGRELSTSNGIRACISQADETSASAEPCNGAPSGILKNQVNAAICDIYFAPHIRYLYLNSASELKFRGRLITSILLLRNKDPKPIFNAFTRAEYVELQKCRTCGSPARQI